ncbi:unnamed protein product [Dovyalis caffra]|uniref:Pectinesterase catalytic domain-containing protein n=1 Tax=Dovyalis caffra TaxID=77055 RepID=A0AAV1SDF6_9ROSI|nr:unnamed protein product [Dovyalis caffra]
MAIMISEEESMGLSTSNMYLHGNPKCSHINLKANRVSSSWSSLDRETDYNRWVSWNANNNRKRALLRAKSTIQTAGADGKSVLDDKLRKAEMNSVRVNVSQDGTGHFKTIKEAVDSIPPYNTRRVIIAIKPGVYRYAFDSLNVKAVHHINTVLIVSTREDTDLM